MSNLLIGSFISTVGTVTSLSGIVSNDDIPFSVRKYLIDLAQVQSGTTSRQLSELQQKNMNSLLEFMQRVSDDIKFVRKLLNMAAYVAEVFKFKNEAVVYALRNISLSNHFNNFLSFAKHRSSVVKREDPLYMLITIGIDILQLAFTHSEKNKNKKLHEMELQRRYLQDAMSKVSVGLSTQFLNFQPEPESSPLPPTPNTQPAAYEDDLEMFNQEVEETIEETIEETFEELETFNEIEEEKAFSNEETFNEIEEEKVSLNEEDRNLIVVAADVHQEDVNDEDLVIEELHDNKDFIIEELEKINNESSSPLPSPNPTNSLVSKFVDVKDKGFESEIVLNIDNLKTLFSTVVTAESTFSYN